MPVATPPPEDAPEEELQDDDQTANFGTPPHLQDIFPPSDEEHEPDLGPVSHCFLRVAVWTVTLYEGLTPGLLLPP